MKKKIIVVIATESKDKISGIQEAFNEFFPDEDYGVKYYYGKTQSDVSDQPFGDETYLGAYNRINNIKAKYDSILKDKEADYYVSCEAGIDDTNKAMVDGKLETMYASEQISCILNTQTGAYSYGKSSSWMIPAEDIKKIKETDLNQYLRGLEYTELHDVGNGNYISRSIAIKQSMESAIATSLFLERKQKIEERKNAKGIDEKQ